MCKVYPLVQFKKTPKSVVLSDKTSKTNIEIENKATKLNASCLLFWPVGRYDFTAMDFLAALFPSRHVRFLFILQTIRLRRKNDKNVVFSLVCEQLMATLVIVRAELKP